MHVVVNGWDWAWMILAIVWVIALGVALFATVNLTEHHPRRPR